MHFEADLCPSRMSGWIVAWLACLSSGLPSYHYLLRLDDKHKSKIINDDGSFQKGGRTTYKPATRVGISIALMVATSRAEQKKKSHSQNRDTGAKPVGPH